MASMTFRELEPEPDAEQVVALLFATNSTIVTNVRGWLHRRAAVPERARLSSVVAEVDGRIAGAADAGLNFFGSGDLGVLGVLVHPDQRNQGIGSALYELAFEHLVSLGAPRATSMFDETEAGLEFARRRGWREVRAEILSMLDPRDVDEQPSPLVELVPARDLDPRELHRVDEEATRDVPAVEELEGIPYDEWRAFVWDNPLVTRDGSFGAVVDGSVAAVSLLTANIDIGRAANMFTGTSREHRGRGLALAVKLASTHWAAANGITQIVTTNDETNAPMLAVNRRLGYRPSGRRVEYLRDLS
jgi:GNAT superfamily N-acetyltransferase